MEWPAAAAEGRDHQTEHGTTPPRCRALHPALRRHLLRLKPEMYAQYTQLHDKTWEEVMAAHAQVQHAVYYHKETGYM